MAARPCSPATKRSWLMIKHKPHVALENSSALVMFDALPERKSCVLLVPSQAARRDSTSTGHQPLAWTGRVTVHGRGRLYPTCKTEREAAQPPCFLSPSFSTQVAEVARAGPHADPFPSASTPKAKPAQPQPCGQPVLSSISHGGFTINNYVPCFPATVACDAWPSQTSREGRTAV